MRDYKLKIDLLPKGAWDNDLSKTLSKKIGIFLEINAMKKRIIDVKFVDMKQMTLMPMKFGNLTLRQKHKL